MNEFEIKLRGWQARAYEFFKDNPRSIYNVATGCLTGDTLIHTKKYGVRPIKDFVGNKGIEVLSFNIKSMKFEYKESDGAVFSKIAEVYEVELNNGMKVKATEDHPFLNQIREYTKTKDLEVGQIIRVYKDNLLINASQVKSITPKGKQKTYDIVNVHDNHNFIANSIIVSNSGKTAFAIYVIKKLIEKDPHMKILIVGPKNVILEQAWLEDLYKFGIGIDKIGLYNGFTREFSQITMVSIQSMKNLVDSGIIDSFDCIIYDELHNYGTANYMKLISIDKPYKIGLTATLERQDRNHIKIKACFDYNIFVYDIEEALNDGILNQFEFYHISIIMDEETRDQYENMSQRLTAAIHSLGGMDLSKLKGSNPAHAAVLKLMQDRKKLISNYSQKSVVARGIIAENKGSKILVFNQLNAMSRDLYWELQEDDVKCDIMNSDISSAKQSEILRDFESGALEVVLASLILDEGFNVPAIDCSIIMAQNSTERQFLQRLGRSLRKKDHDSKVYYITVQDTFEEKYFLDKRERIMKIAKKYTERIVG